MSVIEEYAQEVKKLYETGHAKEHAYRPALERLMNSFEDVRAVNDPKRSEHGNPDMVFLKSSNPAVILGYAEAKDVDISLDKTEKTNQMQRYSGYDNLFLTNYLEFRFYLNGDKKQTINIGELNNGKVLLNPRNYSMLADELQNFLDSKPETIRSGKRLALIMGAKARRIRDRINRKLADEDIKADELDKIFDVMKKLLVHDLTPEKFADMYAQTLVYGLFVARYGDTTKDSFCRAEAVSLIPASNPFLRDFFEHIAGTRFDKDLAQIVDELCEVFQVSDVNTLVHKHLRLFEVENEKDPIIHFYEDFLKEYDPAERKRMGAYYTPVPVVQFIIRQVDEILKREFGIARGLADTSKITKEIDHEQELQIRNQKTGRLQKTTKENKEFHRVQVLDPAVGTATFLNETIKYIHKSLGTAQQGQWESYVQNDLLPRIHGFELMMAPYTIAHLKLGMTLQETGVKNLNQRLGVYLTNTLEEGIPRQNNLFAAMGFGETISHEAEEAAKIKHENPIMVVMGNPPYSGVSSNNTKYANSLVEKYKYEPGGTQKLQEKNPKWINDDYVKFIAFAEGMLQKSGEGIVAMITNHAYLDNPTFRGMRWHLNQTFDKIFVLDLHGNAKKMEQAPNGSKDENVFDIMQGVAIIIAIKTSNSKRDAIVYHSDIFGKRRSKFSALNETINWQQLTLDKQMMYFVYRNNEGKSDYDKGIPIHDLFTKNTLGFQTHRDGFAISMQEDEIRKRLEDLSSILDDENLKEKYNLKDGGDWTIKKARARLNSRPLDFQNSYIVQCAYRPFDNRYTYFDTAVSDRPRKLLRDSVVKRRNITLECTRQISNLPWRHVFISDKPSESCLISNKTKEGNYSFPLYLYHDDGTRTQNFNQEVLKEFTKNLAKAYEPEDILDYIYAVLQSPKYREKYKEFLKIDFPRVPAPKNDMEFKKFVALGKKLRELHLMKSPVLNNFDTAFPEEGTDEVEKVKYEDNKVRINDTQYFGNVPELAWNFYIGGYQPAQKWLKDRKGHKLNNKDIDHYQKIIKILLETDRIMQEIDSIKFMEQK